MHNFLEVDYLIYEVLHNKYVIVKAPLTVPLYLYLVKAKYRYNGTVRWSAICPASWSLYFDRF